jgi:hypothetical protein
MAYRCSGLAGVCSEERRGFLKYIPRDADHGLDPKNAPKLAGRQLYTSADSAIAANGRFGDSLHADSNSRSEQLELFNYPIPFGSSEQARKLLMPRRTWMETVEQPSSRFRG